ncbi:DUF2845 domain-containing protein [Azomonas macrocytogenes]|nr:DUF2845 domain-containing protein [Azomonas macrocytogenes]
MRCGSGIISEGDTIFEVERKCGSPTSREVMNPIIDPNGRTPVNSVPVENWVYGDNNGMYYFLRFINGKLEKIESRRL